MAVDNIFWAVSLESNQFLAILTINENGNYTLVELVCLEE